MQGFRGMHWDALRWEEVFDGTQGGDYISMPFIKDVLYICHLAKISIVESDISVYVLVTAAVGGEVVGACVHKMVRCLLRPKGKRGLASVCC